MFNNLKPMRNGFFWLLALMPYFLKMFTAEALGDTLLGSRNLKGQTALYSGIVFSLWYFGGH